MTKISTAFGAFIGGLTSLAAIAIFYIGNTLFSLPFVPFDIFDWLARILPGNVITLGIDSIVGIVRGAELGATDTAAKFIEQLMALTLFVVVGMLLGMVIVGTTRRQPARATQFGAWAGMALFIPVAAIEVTLGLPPLPFISLTWIAFILVGWGAYLGFLCVRLRAVADEEPHRGRRNLLTQVALGSVGLAVMAWGIEQLLGRDPGSTGASQPLATGPTPTPGSALTPASTTVPQATASTTESTTGRIEPAPGTRPEITSNENFYRIDINLAPPTIDGSAWALQVDGLFDNARPLTLDDLMAMPAVTQPLTLACISNPIGGDLISSSRWTGVRLRDLLEELGLRSAAQELRVEAEDGFYESVTMADMMDARTMLVYGMNDETLPVEHGFPLRIYIPNRYGMKQPKWITRIEAIDSEGPGYWVERGWSSEARPHIISIIDTVADEIADEITQDAATPDNTVPIGGIAWAGDRGIQRVDVQVDDGPWTEAQLRTPPLSGLIWVQWRYDWPLEPGEHTFRVRAVDGEGMLQIEERSDPHPDGATGYHTVTAII